MPFAPEDDTKGSFEEIIERLLYSSHIFLKFENMQNRIPTKDLALNYNYFNRVLSRSREIRVGKYDSETDVAEQHRLQSLQKAMVIQWLCFIPPSTINNSRSVSMKLLFRALMHRSVFSPIFFFNLSFLEVTQMIMPFTLYLVIS